MNDDIPPGTFIDRVWKDTYRTSNGNVYKFSFEVQEEGDYNVRVYIEGMPSYGSHDTSLHTTHRLYDGTRPYVCWDTPLHSVEDAKQVAAEWAKRTERYIKTGKRF